MNPITDPIELFEQWFAAELQQTQTPIPSAVCLSTIGLDGFPNARFVSLKEIVNQSFVITGPMNSQKGIEIRKNEKVALTFWWAETKRQIRIQGKATPISEEMAYRYFNERSLSSKAVSAICEQGKPFSNVQMLEKKVKAKMDESGKIDKPKNWGGYTITPHRMEFMEFKESRFHNRKHFELNENTWSMTQIQP